MKIIRLNQIPNEPRDGYSIKRLLTTSLHCNPNNIGLYETTIPAGSACKYHRHNCLDELIIFLTPGHAVVEGANYNFNVGDVLILEPTEKHEFYADSNEVKLIAIKAPNLVEDKENIRR